MKILVAVEDDEDMRLLIRMQLRDDDRLGVLSEVATADEAIAATRAHRPDLVILDHFIQGQVMGLEAAPMLKVVSPTTRSCCSATMISPSKRRACLRSTPTCQKARSLHSARPCSLSCR